MANTKNTIQNIPLTGPLCLNKLKTDVTQFEGYNEKNTTVFGGELVNIRNKAATITNKTNTYVLLNSKDDVFYIRGKELYANSVSVSANTVLAPYKFELGGYENRNHPEYKTVLNTLIIEKLQNNSFILGQVVVVNDSLWSFSSSSSYTRVGVRFITAGRNSVIDDMEAAINELKAKSFIMTGYTSTAAPNYSSLNYYLSVDDGGKLLFSYIHGDGCKTYACYNFINNGTVNDVSPIRINTQGAGDFITYSVDPEDNNKIYIYTYESGKDNTLNIYLVNRDTVTFRNQSNQPPSYDGNNVVDYFYSYATNKKITTHYTALPDYQNRTLKTVEKTREQNYFITVDANGESYLDTSDVGTNASFRNTKVFHNGEYFLPGIRGNCYGPLTFIDGYLYSISVWGRLIKEPGSIDDHRFVYKMSYSSDSDNVGLGQVTYEDKDKWYSYIFISNGNVFNPQLKDFIIDNRYIPLAPVNRQTAQYYDIEEKKIINELSAFIDTSFVSIGGGDYIDPSTIAKGNGVVYATGYNVNFAFAQTPFCSTLSNPNVGTYTTDVNLTSKRIYLRSEGGYGALKLPEPYLSSGDSVQSAEYIGRNTELQGTLYPIDTNGNIIFPITWDSKVISGYSNNDLVELNGSVYPLIYYNNNQKIYSSYVMASMENIKGAFSLQGQQYTFDDNNIYAVIFNNGIIESVRSVTYKKNMQFLGTLPTSAVFYSFTNKTFYQFTGDVIISKMFEANDIDEIYYVGQNPSTLSLWICTDKGIYVMSDTDMYKIDIVSSLVKFDDNKIRILSENETSYLINDISLYDIGNDAQIMPIKLATKYYGLGGELKANYDCWYIRLHNAGHKNGKLKLKVNTITNTSFETEEKTFEITGNQYDVNNQVYIRYQPKYQTAVAMQLELESDIAIYQISLGVNATDTVSQQSKFNF